MQHTEQAGRSPGAAVGSAAVPGRFGPVASLPTELSAGLTAALVSLPQNMAHGLVAFLPLGTEWATTGLLAGLYSALFVGIASCLLGSSRLLVSGPRVAGALVFSALLGQLLGQAVGGGTLDAGQAVTYAFLAVVLSGLAQVGFGLTRLGNLVKYVPFPVIAGFLTASGLLVLASQVRALTGLPGSAPGMAAYAPLALACLLAFVTLRLPRRLLGIPSMAVSLVLGSALYHLAADWPGALPLLGGTLAKVPASLPEPALLTRGAATLLRWETLELLPLLCIAALSIATVSALDTLLTMVALDNRTLERSDENRELLAQGLGNAVAGLFCGIPGAGSMARTIPMLNAGGSSQLANLACLALTALAVVWLPPLIGLLPQAVMGGILIVIGVQLLDRWSLDLLLRPFRRDQRLTQGARGDLLVVALVVLVALGWDLITAVVFGVVLSAVLFIKHMSRSLVRRSYSGANVRARRFAGERSTRLLEAHGQRIHVLELEGAVFFASADLLEQRVERLVESGITHFVFDMKRISAIDSSGAKVLQRICLRLAKRGIYVAFGYVEKERRRREQTFPGDDRRYHASVRR
ncbi:MAG TPA: SulP family inorganic anion transporter, partial [Gammaproteobacteria bacterium]